MTRLTVWRVFWRSLFIQAGFSSEGMQTLGLVYALMPALKALYPDPAARQRAVQRHLTTFNTHPYVSAAIVGGILFHEQRVARGEEPEASVERFKASLMGPLAALGDGFFWLSLRPACAAVSVALVPFVSAWAAVIFLLLFNLVHLSSRSWLFWEGLRLGEGMMPHVSRLHVNAWAQRLRWLASVSVAFSAGWLATTFTVKLQGGRLELVGLGCVSAAAGAGLVAQRSGHPYVAVYLAALGALALGALW